MSVPELAAASANVALQGPRMRHAVTSSWAEPGLCPCWVAVYTKQHHEKRVAEHLAAQSFDCYLPLCKSQRKWSNHRTAVIEMPLFPTYLFVHTSRRTRTQILRTPGVIGIVGRGSGDDPISDDEIEILRNGLHLRNPEPHELAVGENVRIAAGPLEGMQGTVVRHKSSLRVVITVPMIRQSVSVEVAAAELESVQRTGTPLANIQ